MGDSIAESLNTANAPIVGMPTNILHIPGRFSGIISKENTPDAVTPREALSGIGMSAVNIGYALAPELALPVRAAVNATLGAASDSENRVRGATAGLLFGETLHGITKVGQRLVRGRPVAETPVISDPVAPAPTYEDFANGVDQVAGDVTPKAANGNRKAVPGYVNEKYRLDTDETLLARATGRVFEWRTRSARLCA
jgi:hypothetical protein